MNKRVISVRPWSGGEILTEAEIKRLLNAEGLQSFRWSSLPGEVLEENVSSCQKIIYILDGSITFCLPASRQQVTLYLGDRLDLPADTIHTTVVGPEGVVCLEGQRPGDGAQQSGS
jgi:hypothetical protein